MTEFVQITTTTGKRQDAEQIAAELISQQLAACVQVSGPVVSTFRWEGKVETLEEWVCTIKTTAAKRGAIEKLFKDIHPYKVPELIVTAMVGGSAEYLAWVEGEVR